MNTTRSVLQAIIDHCSSGGLFRGFDQHGVDHPLIAAGREALLASDDVSVPRALGLHPDDVVLRRNTLGSSEVAAVLGLNPWASPHNVWLAKVHGQEFEGNERTELGQILEPTIMGIYCDRYRKKIVKGRYTVGPHPWMSCTPDGLVVEASGVPVVTPHPLCEAKLVGLRTLWMWGPGNTDEEESDAVPLHYLCQALWQIACTGAPYVDVSALLGTEFRSYRVRRDDRVIGNMIDQAGDWWHRYVVTGTPPPVDGSKGAGEMLKKIYPDTRGERLAADEALEALATSVRESREALERAAEAEKLAVNRMKEAIRDAPGAFGDGWNVRYKHQKDGKRPFVFDGKTKTGKAA